MTPLKIDFVFFSKKKKMTDVVVNIFSVLYPNHSADCHSIEQIDEMIMFKFRLIKRNRKLSDLIDIYQKFNLDVDDMEKFSADVTLKGENADKFWQVRDIVFNKMCDKIERRLLEVFDGSYSDQQWFRKLFGMEPRAKTNLKPYLRRKISTMVKKSVDDNWPEMLEIALTYEDKWPPKPPHMFYVKHSCKLRKELIVTLLNDAYETAENFGYQEIIEILDAESKRSFNLSLSYQKRSAYSRHRQMAVSML